MPPTLTYPGVYIEELPSGVFTITGVATSIAAFVGWAAQGSTTEAVLVQSFSDYQREFGGLDSRTYLGYAVNQFFNNGGQQAYVVRLVQSTEITTGTATGTSASVTVQTAGGAVVFTAKSLGAWPNTYGILVSPGSGGAGTFNVSVVYAPGGTALVTLETHSNVTISTVGSITSAYVTAATSGSPSAPPGPGTYMLTGGTDGNGVNVPAAAAALVTIFAPNSTTEGFTFTAQSPGSWGNLLAIGATAQAGDTTNTRFSVNVVEVNPDGSLSVLETFNNVSVNASDPSYVVTVINADSNYVSAAVSGSPTQALNSPFPPSTPTQPPFNSPPFLIGGYDGVVLDPTADGASGGLFMTALNADGSGTGGVQLLDRVDIFNLLCVPGESEAVTIANLQGYCNSKRALYIVDAPQAAGASPTTVQNLAQSGPAGNDAGSLTGPYSINSAYYFPWVQAPDPLIGNRQRLFPPCGFVAGIYAATDANSGVWKAPAGIDAGLTGESGLQYVLTDAENGSLNPQAINCLRHFKVYGDVVWGARTLQGNDQAGSQWKYVPIRRLALYIESSLYDGTQWVVFEPNDETLWGQIRLNVGTFMQGLFLQGAFQGTTPQQAYFVKCDSEINPQSSIDQGVVNILVGFAPLYPAEFVVIQIQQMAGQLQT
jgi:uncharacterized protein